MDRRRPAHAVRSVFVVVLAATAVLATACSRDDPASVASGAAPATQAARGSAPVPTSGSAPPATASPGTTGTTAIIAAPPTSAPATSSPSTAPTTPSTARATTTSQATPPVGSAAPANHPVAQTSLALVDSSRSTVSRGSTIAGTRSLPTTVYYPSDGGGPYPLVVFAHGFQIGPGPYASFCRELAAAGYVVAAPSFPLTDANRAGANLDRGDLPNQAGDVSFVISSVAASGASPLSGVVDGGRVGVVGHSDGADTALDTGYYPGRNDPRIKAVAALSPDAMTGPGGSVGAGTPLLLQHGDRDSIVPYANSTTVWGQVKAHRFFLTLTGADHLPPVQGAAPWAPVLEAVTVDFLDRYVAGRQADDSDILEDGAQPGVSTIKTAS